MLKHFAYRPELDGLRALAVCGVFVYHLNSSWLPGGFLGVDIFFVLSGFLITSLLLSERDRTGRVDLMRFYVRRARRLLPAMVLMLIAVAVYFGQAASPLDRVGLRQDLIAALLYVANWNFILDGDSYFTQYVALAPVRHTWSLAIEEQFYMVWPIIVAVVGGIRKRLTAVAIPATAASAVALAFAYQPADPSSAYFSSLTRIHEPLIGVLLALVLNSASGPLVERTAGRFLPVAVGFLAYCFATVTDNQVFYYRGGSLLISLATAVLIGGLPRSPSTHRILSTQPLVAIGIVSYGLYLWHWPVIVAVEHRWGPTEDLMRALIVAAVTAAIALLSYRLIEKPIRAGTWTVLARSSDRRQLIAVPVISALSIVLFVAAVTEEDLPDWADQAEPEILNSSSQPNSSESTLSPPAERPPVIGVVGDSVALSLIPGFRMMAEAGEISLLEAAVAACPVGYEPLYDDAGVISPYAEDCAVVAESHSALLAAGPDVIVWHDLQSVLPRRDANQALLLSGTEAWQSALVQAWLEIVNRFVDSGAEVLILYPPLRSLDTPGCDGSVGPDRCREIQTQDERIRDATLTLEKRIGDSESVTFVHVDSFVCPDGYPCPSQIDGVQIRHPDWDQTHFTEDGARWIVPKLLDGQ